MQSINLTKLESNLYSKVPIINSCIRQRAATALAKEGSSESLQILAEALCKSEDRNVQAIALKALRGLGKQSKQGDIDAVCAIWERTRNPKLAEVMKQQEWTAAAPAKTRVLTALKIGKQKRITKATSQVVKPLIEAFEDEDSEIATSARECAINLQNREAIDYLCAQWAKRREPIYEQIILQAGYFSTESIELKVLTALKVNRHDLLPVNDPEVLQGLLKVYEDQDNQIREQAENILHNLTERQAIESLCDAVIARNDAVAQRVISVAHYLPIEEGKQALFYFITEQWEEYLRIDPQHSILADLYNQTTEPIKERLREKIAQHQQLAFISIITGIQTHPPMRNLSDQEWQWLLDVLTEQQAVEWLWYYAQLAPLLWSHKFVLSLESGLGETLEQEKLRQALSIAKKCTELTVNLTVLTKCQNILEGHTDKVTSLAISPDNTLVASGSLDNTIRLQKVATGELIAILSKHKNAITTLCFSPDGLLLISTSEDKTAQIWNLKESKKTITLPRVEPVMALSNDGKLLAIASTEFMVKIHKVFDGKELVSLEGHTAKINSLCFSPDNTQLASGSEDKTVKLWRIPEGTLIKTFESHSAPVTKVTFSPNSQSLLTGARDNKAMIQDLETNTEISLSGHLNAIIDIAVTPDNQRVITASENGTLKVWQLWDGYSIATKTDHMSSISGLVISNQGDFMVSASLDKMILLWDLGTVKNIGTLSPVETSPTAIALSPDGQWLVTADSNKIKVWTSDFYRLTTTPLHLFTLEDKEWVESQVKTVSKEQAEWLKLFLMLG